MFSSIAIALAALFGSMAIGAIIIFVTYTRRKKAQDLQKEEERLMRGEF